MSRLPAIQTIATTVTRRMRKVYWRGYHRTRRSILQALPTRPAPRMATDPRRRRHHIKSHPGYGLEPDDLFPIFVHAEHGDPRRQCQLFDDLLERDATTRNLFEQRAGAVAGKPWVIQAGGNEPEDADAAAALAESVGRIPDFVGFLEHQLSHNRYAYAASELDWTHRHGRIEIARIENVHADAFCIATPINTPGQSRPGELLLCTDTAPIGEPLAPGKWAVSTRPGSMNLARRGLMRTCAWYCMFKLFAVKDWAVYAARFGIPLVIGKIDDFADQESKRIAEEIVARIGDDGGAVMPSDFVLDIHDGGRKSNKSDVHGGLIMFCNAENSKAVYGSTLSNDNGQSGGASYALGTTHAGVRWENVIRDAVFLQEMFRRDIAIPYMHYNNLPGAAPVLRMQVAQSLSPEQIAKVADYLVNRLGMPISEQQLRHMLGFREPLNDDDIVRGLEDSA